MVGVTFFVKGRLPFFPVGHTSWAFPGVAEPKAIFFWGAMEYVDPTRLSNDLSDTIHQFSKTINAMKNLNLYVLMIATFLLTGLNSFGQGISYQAVARDAAGALRANETISVKFLIREATANGTVVYEETHSTSTNDYALFALTIGKGSAGGGTVFDDIDWGGDDHFLEVEVNGTSMGATQLETVPYSKVATDMGISQLTDVNVGAAVVDDVLKWTGTEWTAGADAVDDADASPTNEIQTLSLTGDDLSLSNGGGTVTLPSSSVWSTNGNEAYYDSGNVGIGTNNPSEPLHVVSSVATGNLARFENTSLAANNDLIEIRAQSGAADNGQFIEMQRGSTVEARINTDGSAEFLNVTVEEDLGSSATPIKGRVYADALPVAYAYVSSGTTTASLVTDYGIASLTKPAGTTGEYRLVLNKAIVGQPVIIATSYDTTPDDEIVTANRISATEIEINVANGTGAGVNSNFYVVVYGRTN